MITRVLSKKFLDPYYEFKDPFKTLLARATYLTKYCRNKETWTDTIKRVVLGNVSLDPNVTQQEIEELFDLFWWGKGFPPGRGFWTGGVEGIPVDARYNCHYGTLRHYEDWCWAANMLMCGGGVGIGLLEIHNLPVVENNSTSMLHVLCSKNHPNVNEVMPDNFISNPSDYYWDLVDDSREGWIHALRQVFKYAFEGKKLVLNVSPVRARGELIKTFGGISCGPGPLVFMLRAIWTIICSAQGRKLNSVECLDITNHIGMCIKSGNVRRSALIQLGHADDTAFRNAKKNLGAVMSHRHSSNNSIIFDNEEIFKYFDYDQLVEDNMTPPGCEPGIFNLWRIRQTDPEAEGVNPCGEIPLHNREACCLSEFYPAFNEFGTTKRGLQLITRYTLRQRLQSMSDPEADRIRIKNMRIGVALGGICDFDWNEYDIQWMKNHVVNTGRDYAMELGINIPIAFTTVKPSGTISLMNGSSPGIHAPYAPFYIRRSRIAINDPMFEAMVEAGIPYELCSYDNTNNTAVFSFPTKAIHNKYFATRESFLNQIKRQKFIQEKWADNSVSASLSFNREDAKEVASILKSYVPYLKSTSLLCNEHSYEQPPYEEINEEIYNAMYNEINHNHPLTHDGNLEVDECATNICPI